jgi:hypothetical protein
MARKRRKLSKDMEAEIKAAHKKVEFISALIRDIREEDIQNEYAKHLCKCMPHVPISLSFTTLRALLKKVKEHWSYIRVFSINSKKTTSFRTISRSGPQALIFS